MSCAAWLALRILRMLFYPAQPEHEMPDNYLLAWRKLRSLRLQLCQQYVAGFAEADPVSVAGIS